jgi:hypothetical protein
VEDPPIIVGTTLEPVEDGHARVITADRFAVDHRGRRPDRRHGLSDERIALGPVVARLVNRCTPSSRLRTIIR